jgi:hypothetical protein
MDASGVGYVSPTDFENFVQRSSMRAAQHDAIDPPRNPPFPQPLFSNPFDRRENKYVPAGRKKPTYGS